MPKAQGLILNAKYFLNFLIVSLLDKGVVVKK